MQLEMLQFSSAATLFRQGAVLSGLWATQRNEYPVTVRSGHSIAEIVLSPQEILYTGISKPDLIVALFPEGLAKVKSHFPNMTPKDTLFLDFKDAGGFSRKKENWVMMALARILDQTGIYPLEALEAAIAMQPRFAEQNLAALEAAQGILIGES